MYSHKAPEAVGSDPLMNFFNVLVSGMDSLFQSRDSLFEQINLIHGIMLSMFIALFILCCCVLYMAIKLRKQL